MHDARSHMATDQQPILLVLVSGCGCPAVRFVVNLEPTYQKGKHELVERISSESRPASSHTKTFTFPSSPFYFVV